MTDTSWDTINGDGPYQKSFTWIWQHIVPIKVQVRSHLLTYSLRNRVMDDYYNHETSYASTFMYEIPRTRFLRKLKPFKREQHDIIDAHHPHLRKCCYIPPILHKR